MVYSAEKKRQSLIDTLGYEPKEFWEEMGDRLVNGLVMKDASELNEQTAWKNAMEYLQWCKDNPLMRPELVRSGKGGGETVWVPVPKPMTMEEFCVWMGLFVADVKRVVNKAENTGLQQMFKILAHIFRNQKYEMALIGVYNYKLVMLELGITDLEEESSANIQITTIAAAPGLGLAYSEEEVNSGRDEVDVTE